MLKTTITIVLLLFSSLSLATSSGFTKPYTPVPVPVPAPYSLASNPSYALTRLLSRIHTMQADFVAISYKKKGAGMVMQRQNGHMSLQRPGKFKWQVIAPDRQIIVANDNQLWYYDADLNQVTKKVMDMKQPGSPAMLLVGKNKDLTAGFTVERLGLVGYNAAFLLKPKDVNSLYQEVRLYFVRGQLQEMQVTDNLGQKTHINFTNLIINQPIYPATFNFVPPMGADVVQT